MEYEIKTGKRKGYFILALSVLFNGSSVHLVRVALQSLTPPMATVVSAFAAAVAFVLAGWVWRRLGWRWGGLGQRCANLPRLCLGEDG